MGAPSLRKSNPLRRDNPPSFIIMTRGIAGSQVTLCGEWRKSSHSSNQICQIQQVCFQIHQISQQILQVHMRLDIVKTPQKTGNTGQLTGKCITARSTTCKATRQYAQSTKHKIAEEMPKEHATWHVLQQTGETRFASKYK